MINLKSIISYLSILIITCNVFAQEYDEPGNDDSMNKVLMNNDFEYGITIINHGAQFFGSNPFGWMTEMAEAIRVRAGSAKILQYNKATGLFDILPGYDTVGETILIYDWVSESDNFAEGFSESAADALFAALLMGEQRGDFTLQNFHFIGHSRGCSVNSETVERLLRIGVEVEHVTNLDPHDWGAFTLADDYDVNPDTLVITEPSSRSPNRGIVAWEDVVWADSYWQTAGLAGRSVYGTYNLQLDEIGHSEVHTWYLGTIDNTSGISSWYGGEYPERNESGFNYSRIGGLTRPAESGDREPIIFEFEEDGIVNGDFERGPTLSFSQYPGWSEHGGGGDGEIENKRLILNQTGNSREHNRFYIPPYSEKLKFFYKVSNFETGSLPDIDKFQLSIKTNNNGDIYDLLYEEYIESELEKEIEVNISAYTNSIATILMEVVEGGNNNINSRVEIDDIILSVDKRVRVDLTILLAGAYQNGNMKTTLRNLDLVPFNQPYNTSPWNYNGDESISSVNENVVDWVLLELRDKNDNTSVLEKRASLLLDSGKIVDIDGQNPVPFLLPPDEYFISVHHRNHIPIMSAYPIELTSP